MKSRLGFLLVLLGFGLSLNLSAQVKVGHVNLQRVLNAMPEMGEVNKSLITYQNELIQQAKDREKDLDGYYRDVMRKMENGMLTASQQTEESAKIEEMKKGVSLAYESIEGQLVEKKKNLLFPVYKKLEKTIEVVAKESSYAFVFNNNGDAQGMPTLLYGSLGIDITEQVMEKLGLR